MLRTIHFETLTDFGKKIYGRETCYSLEKRSYPRACSWHPKKLAERIIINPMATPTDANLTYPLPQCSLIVTADMIPISCELFRLASAKVPQRYPGRKDYCVTLIGES